MSDFGFGDIFGIGSIVNGLLGYQGQKKTNEANIEMARESNSIAQQMAINQTAFQERMSNTSYQRAIKDMSAAGLNPMLAYSQGGSSTPSGAQAAVTTPTIGNALGAAGNSAMAAAALSANLANTKSQTALNDSMAAKASAETLATMNSAEMSRFEIDKMLGLRHYNLESEKTVRERDALVAAQEIDAREAGPDKERLGYMASRADLQKRIAEGFLTQSDVPRARAERDYYEGIGKYQPYAEGAADVLGSAISSALGLKRLFRSGPRLGR